jgi:hypothetical protein
MRICSLSVPRLKHEWNQTVWSVNNLRCGTADLGLIAAALQLPRDLDSSHAWHRDIQHNQVGLEL